jgi:hypothetical protein
MKDEILPLTLGDHQLRKDRGLDFMKEEEGRLEAP